MKSKMWNPVIAMTVSAALALPVQLAAQSQQDHHDKHHHYQVVDLGSTFGGPGSFLDPGSGNDFNPFVPVVNNRGTVAGFAETSVSDPFSPICFWNCLATHAFRAEKNGVLTDLGTLPGAGNSSAPLWISENGLIAGTSENGETDPLYAGLPELHAVLWQHGKITDLGTLPEGGYQSEANSVNNAGQVVGAALNTVSDSNSMQAGTFWLWGGYAPPYQYQTRAFLWDKQNGMQDLGTLPGGTDAQALMINERGQVIGYSYTGSTQAGVCFPLATSSFLWEKGEGMVDLGGFGGTCTAAGDLNNHGQVVGFSTVAGDTYQRAFLWEHGSILDLGGSLGGNNTGAFVINENGKAVGFAFLPGDTVFHATLWRHIGKMTDLGVLGSDLCSYATGINAEMQVIGALSSTCDDSATFRAFLWEDGSMVDLNALFPKNSNLHVGQVFTINDRGEIAGEGDDSSGNGHAVLLIPCDENHPGVEGCDYTMADGSAEAQGPESTVRELTTTAPRTPAVYGRGKRMLRRRLGPMSGIHRIAAPDRDANDPSVEGGACTAAEATATTREPADLALEIPPSTDQSGSARQSRRRAEFCQVSESNNTLTGSCVVPTFPHIIACVKFVSDHAQCSPGVHAIKPVTAVCGLQSFRYDQSRGCTAAN